MNDIAGIPFFEAQFDKDGDKRLNAEERKTGREFTSRQGAGRHRGVPDGIPLKSILAA